MSPFAGVKISDTFAEESTGVRNTILVEGDNLLEITGVVPSPEKTESGKEFFSYRTKVVDGHPQNVGKPFSHLASFSDGAGFTHGIITATGLDVKGMRGGSIPTYAHFAALAAKLDAALKGKRVGVIFYTDNYNGKEATKVSQFYPADRFVKQTTATTAPAENLEDVLGKLMNGNAG